MPFPYLSCRRCFWAVVSVLFAIGQAAAAEFHYIGPLLASIDNGLPVGPNNRITIDVTYDPSNLPWSVWGTMSDGTHTITSGTPGASVSCDYMPIVGMDVFRCDANQTTASGNVWLHANSFYGDDKVTYWAPDDESQGPNWHWKMNGQGWWTSGPDFTISAAPFVQVVKAGKSTSYQLSIAVTGTLIGTVQLACESVPLGATCTIAPATGGGYTATLDTSPGKKGTLKGTYTVVFRGTDGALAHDASVSLIVK